MTKKFFLTISFIFLCFISKAQQQQFYTGFLDDYSVEAEITWNANKTINGSYSLTRGVYWAEFNISGNNYVDGKIKIDVFFDGRRTGGGTLNKTLKNKIIVWSGDIINNDGSRSYIVLNRSRR